MQVADALGYLLLLAFVVFIGWQLWRLYQ